MHIKNLFPTVSMLIIRMFIAACTMQCPPDWLACLINMSTVTDSPGFCTLWIIPFPKQTFPKVVMNFLLSDFSEWYRHIYYIILYYLFLSFPVLEYGKKKGIVTWKKPSGKAWANCTQCGEVDKLKAAWTIIFIRMGGKNTVVHANTF